MSAFIEARELRKTYRVGKVDVPALRGVSFSVQKGEFVTVVGPSGSGKSTLFYLLGGLTRADSGSVTIDGVDFATLSDGERTRLRKSKIGFVFQKFNLLPTLSARSNIEIAADIAGMASARSHVPEEDHRDARHRRNVSIIGPTSFPAASSRRVALARALINRPAIVLADEPTGNLDSKKLRDRARHAAPVEQGIGADRADDHAQSRSRRVWRSHRPHARRPDRDAG